jgi:hypothetical protein
MKARMMAGKTLFAIGSSPVARSPRFADSFLANGGKKEVTILLAGG